MTPASLLAGGRALWRSRVGRVGRILVLMGLAAYLLHTVDIAGALDRASRADPLIVVVAIIVLTSVHLVAALNWRTIVARLGGVPLTRRSAIRAYYASQALGGITPGNLGGDAYRVVAVRSAGGDWAGAALGVLVQRATSFAALGLLGVVALAALPNVLDIAGPLIASAVGLAVVLTIPGLLVLRRRRGVAGTTGRPALSAATLIGLAGGAAFHAFAIAASYALVIAVDPHVSGIAILAAVALARLSLAVPIAPSGIGVQESVLAALFVLLGASPETAVAASLLGRLALLTTTAIGLALVARRPTWTTGATAPLPAPVRDGAEVGTAR